MSKQVKFKRSEGGYTESKCGRYTIEPIFRGRTTADEYKVVDTQTGDKRKFDTQRECKAWAQGRAAIEANVESLRQPHENGKPVATSREQAFNAKRADRIRERGVNVDNIVDAAVGLTGYDKGECALCDHAIKWLFVLHLTTSDKGVVTFEPVGSTCIKTWAQALPLGPAQERILAALKLADADADVVRARFRDIRVMERTGELTEDQASALIRFYSSPSAIRDHGFLSSVADQVFQRDGFTARQWETWSVALNREIGNLNAPCCGDCGAPTRYRAGKWGEFYGCTTYPACRWTQNIKWERPDTDEREDEPEGTPPSERDFDGEEYAERAQREALATDPYNYDGEVPF